MQTRNKYDVIVVGGGTSGCAASYIAAKLGLKTLIIEKNLHLGGTITSALVTPAMKTNAEGINTEFFNDLIKYLEKYNGQVTYLDGNSGWFNPEILKIALDDMMKQVECDILYNTEFFEIKREDSGLFKIAANFNSLSLYFESDFIVDATGFGFVFQNLNCEFLNPDNISQSTSLRFTMSNIDLKKFEKWILKIDKDRNVTSSCHIGNEIHLSTAYTWDTNKNWALEPIFKKAIENDDLNPNDTAYFQVFTIPGMSTSLAFNCPRIVLDSDNKINSPEIYSKSVANARFQVYRISKFCQKYLPGFKSAYISNIADMLGIRESGRIKGKYVYSESDIVSKNKFKTIAASCDYPIDIHSSQQNQSELSFAAGNYYLPIESLISSDYDNLFAVGRCLSASFKAQAALRTQTTCFSMGEAVARYIKSKLI